MKGISRRTRACAVVVATSAAVLATAGAAGAQAPEKVGNGVPTGQAGVQMFNYGGFINNGGGVTGGSSGGTKTAAELGINIAPAADGSSCATATSTECRYKRLDALFAFLKAKGLDHVELFGHSAFPANNNIGTPDNSDGSYGLRYYRALLDKNGLHCAGWHGDMSEANWDARLAAARILGCDSVGSGGFPSPGIGSYDNTLRTVEALNRLGKRAIEAGVGPVYFHNHQGEFRNRYIDNGVRKTAWQIVMERMDGRYAFAEIDAGWSSDAYDDVTGTVTAGLINQFPDRVKMLHIKDMRNTAPANPPSEPLACGQPGEPACQNSSPVAFGTGEIDWRPIFAAAANRVQYYHQEHDGGSLNDADISLTNFKGTGPNVKGSVLVLPQVFESVAAGTPAADNAQVVTIKNTGDAPLTVNSIALLTGGNARQDESPGDFQVLSNTCTGTGVTIAPEATCTATIGFKPTTSGKTSVARVRVTSSADDGSETFYVVGRSTNAALGGVGGTVDSVLSLTLGTPASFGAFVPATARTYDTAMTASIVSTAGNAILSVTDPSSTATGRLVNGEFALSQPLQVRANNAASPSSAFQPLSTTPGGAAALLLYTGPTAGADNVTIEFRQAIAANEVLRAGSYSKTLTFTVSTTTP